MYNTHFLIFSKCTTLLLEIINPIFCPMNLDYLLISKLCCESVANDNTFATYNLLLHSSQTAIITVCWECPNLQFTITFYLDCYYNCLLTMPKRKKKAEVTDDCGETQKKVKTSPGDIADSPTAGPHFVIEHCKSWSVYKRNAVRVGALLSAQYPDIPIVMNPGKPRSKSFEVTYFPGTTPEEGKEEGSTLIWSGLKLGPPRKLKFVEDNKLVELLKGNMKWCGILWWSYYNMMTLV